MSTPEQAPRGPETTPNLEASTEQYDKLREKIENGAELGSENGEKAVEKAKVEALKNAISVEAGGAEKGVKQPKEGPAPTKRRGGISKKEKDASFKKHMKQVQAEMSAPERAFSKVIHNKAIEKTSEFIAATVARPNAILSGAVVAFVLVLVVYLLAKNLGYVLSGFETIGAFIVGWAIGVLYDYFRVMVTGKK
jgi:F0F1-type ATP synthase assembly protein I